MVKARILNWVRYLSRQMSAVAKEHIDGVHRVMEYCVATQLQGRKLKPRRKWDGKDKSFQFEIKRKSDSDYTICKETRINVSVWAVYLEGAPILGKISMQKMIVFYITEA